MLFIVSQMTVWNVITITIIIVVIIIIVIRMIY